MKPLPVTAQEDPGTPGRRELLTLAQHQCEARQRAAPGLGAYHCQLSGASLAMITNAGVNRSRDRQGDRDRDRDNRDRGSVRSANPSTGPSALHLMHVATTTTTTTVQQTTATTANYTNNSTTTTTTSTATTATTATTSVLTTAITTLRLTLTAERVACISASSDRCPYHRGRR
jgi:hypothetical protein